MQCVAVCCKVLQQMNHITIKHLRALQPEGREHIESSLESRVFTNRIRAPAHLGDLTEFAQQTVMFDYVQTIVFSNTSTPPDLRGF